MTLQDDLRANQDVVLAFAAALETEIGRDAVFAVGPAQATIADIVPEDGARVVGLDFATSTGLAGVIALVAAPAFAATLERDSADVVLMTATITALTAAASALATVTATEVEAHADNVHEYAFAALAGLLGDDIVVFPMLDGTDPVACLVIGAGAVTATSRSGARAPATATATVADGTPLVLADVEMGVTAELGCSQMTLRELLSITPGAVIDLDRTVGTPVDLLVNGTAIARGEVVIVDEEFGVRITEILSNRSSAL